MRNRILLVEDEYALQATIKEYLEPNYQVFSAANASSALKSIKETHYNAVLVDLGLPDKSGLDVIKFIKENKKNVIIIALTGDRSSESVQQAIKNGVDDYLVKPIDRVKLLERLDKSILKKMLA